MLSHDMLKRIDAFKDKNNIILLAYGGSHAYGTNTETSDIDLRGIATNTPEEILSLNVDKPAYVDLDADTTIYYLFQMINLLADANPNVIEILGCKPEHYFILTEEGKLILDNKDIFLSQKAARSFAGYANQQLRRLQNALARDRYPQEEKEQHILNSIRHATHHLQSHYEPYTDDDIRIYLDDATKDHLVKEVFIDVALKQYPLRDFAGINSEMMAVIKGYDKLNHRNRKKDVPHLLKHAMHLIRLYHMAEDILMKGEINTYRPEREFLLDIRNGKYTYEQIFAMAGEYEQKLQEWAAATKLPVHPDYEAINALKVKISKRVLEGCN